MPDKKASGLVKERGVLLVCMSIAFLLWVFLKLSKTYESSKVVQLEYRLPIGQAFSTLPPESLRAQVSGQGWDLLAQVFQRKTPAVTLDLKNYRRPEIEREELMRLIGEELGMKVNILNISRLEFNVENIATRKVPVFLEQNIDYAPDFFLRDSSIRIYPDSVVLGGTADALSLISGVVTERLELRHLRSPQKIRVKLLSPGNGEVQLSEDSVEVTLEVEQFTEMTFRAQVIVSGSQDSIRIVPSHAMVTCVVSMSDLEKIKDEDFELEIDIAQIAQKTARQTIPLKLTKSPVWARSTDFQPKAVEYFIVE